MDVSNNRESVRLCKEKEKKSMRIFREDEEITKKLF